MLTGPQLWQIVGNSLWVLVIGCALALFALFMLLVIMGAEKAHRRHRREDGLTRRCAICYKPIHLVWNPYQDSEEGWVVEEWEHVEHVDVVHSAVPLTHGGAA